MMVFAAAVHSAELPPPVDSGSLEGDLAALAERIAELTGSDQARAALAGLVPSWAATRISPGRWRSGCLPPSGVTCR
jgi:hypothetical protein